MDAYDEDYLTVNTIRSKTRTLRALGMIDFTLECLEGLKEKWSRKFENEHKSYASREWRLIRNIRQVIDIVEKQRTRVMARNAQIALSARRKQIYADLILSTVSGGITQKQQERIRELEAKLTHSRERKVEEKDDRQQKRDEAQYLARAKEHELEEQEKEFRRRDNWKAGEPGDPFYDTEQQLKAEEEAKRKEEENK